MSEYQYYEFVAIDRPLAAREMADLRSLSTRAEITPVSFVNEYQWGSFKGDPLKLMHQYFDAHVYTANWGTHQFMLRLPRGLVEEEAIAPYGSKGRGGENGLVIDARADSIVLDFYSENEEGGDWEEAEGEGRMAGLVPLRDAILAGDYRSLYIAWLAGVQFAEDDDETQEPPVPAGMQKLTAPLKALADFLRLDEDLLAVAAEGAAGAPPAGPKREDLLAHVGALPAAEKDAMLLRLAEGEGPAARLDLMRGFRQAQARLARDKSTARKAGGRTAGVLIKAAAALGEARRQHAAQAKAAERARREREEAAARATQLDALAGREAAAWKEVDALILIKPPKYKTAVALLRDLRDLNARDGRQAAFAQRIRGVYERYAKRSTLIKLLDGAGLTPPRTSA